MSRTPHVSRGRKQRLTSSSSTTEDTNETDEYNQSQSLNDSVEEISMSAGSGTKNGTIKLNVGGVHYETALDTLKQKSGFVKALLSGKFGDRDESNGCYFIDRNPEYFKYLLNYLRYGYMQIPTALAIHLKAESLYYQIDINFSGIEKYTKVTKHGQILVVGHQGAQESKLLVNGKECSRNSHPWRQIQLDDTLKTTGDVALAYAQYLVRMESFRIVHHSRSGTKWICSYFVLEKDIPKMIQIPFK